MKEAMEFTYEELLEYDDFLETAFYNLLGSSGGVSWSYKDNRGVRK